MEENRGIMPVMDYGNGNNEWWWIIILFALMGGNWNRGDYVTPTQLQQGFDNSNVMNKLGTLQQTITSGLCDGFYAQNTNTLNGFASAQNTMAQGFAGLNTAIVDARYQTGGQIADLGFAVKDCCCTTNRNIDSVKYENAQNTTAITNAIHAEGEATRALIQQNEVQALRDKLETANNTISNMMQSREILGQIGTYYTNPPCYGNGCACA